MRSRQPMHAFGWELRVLRGDRHGVARAPRYDRAMNAGREPFRVAAIIWVVFRNRCEGGMAKLVNMGNRRAARGSGGEPERDLRPSRSEAEDAVRTLIRWAGDDPDREGLRGTPGRVVRAYEEWFWGYTEDPAEYLQRTFEEVAGYDEVVVLRDIRFEF